MKLPIKTKKDWCILLVISFIALYYISMYFDMEIEEIMFGFSPDQLNAMNYPGGWGNLVLVGIIMTFLVILIMLIQKKNKKQILLVSTIGIAFAVGMFAGFVIHTNLIVGTGKSFTPTSIRIDSFDTNTNIDLAEDSPLGRKFSELAVSLKALPKSEQKILKKQKANHDVNTYHIWISYPKKYGQSFDLILYLQGDEIYSYHGLGSPDSRVFYKDNGFCKLLQKIIIENQS